MREHTAGSGIVFCVFDATEVKYLFLCRCAVGQERQDNIIFTTIKMDDQIAVAWDLHARRQAEVHRGNLLAALR